MKKTVCAVLVLMLLAGIPCFAAEEGEKNFDPAAVAAGMQENVNRWLSNNVTVAEADTYGLYKVYFQAIDMGCYLTVSGSEKAPEVRDRIGVSQIFMYEAETAETYLTFFLAVCSGVEQYVTGEDYIEIMKTLTDMFQTTMNSSDMTGTRTVGDYTVTAGVESGSGFILLDFEIKA